MTRLIDADNLKEAFENLASDDYNEPIWYQQTVFETIDNAPTVEYSFEKAFQKTVCEQRLYCPERPQGEWFPVSEGLPEFSGLYLISIDSLVTVMNFSGTHFTNSGGVRVEVDAWQPLPKPYKEGDGQ